MVDPYQISCDELSIRISENKIINRDNIASKDSERNPKHTEYDSIPSPIDK